MKVNRICFNTFKPSNDIKYRYFTFLSQNMCVVYIHIWVRIVLLDLKTGLSNQKYTISVSTKATTVQDISI